jgi:photosystem II stability/assembly factor-like uncharacterized protein
LTIAPVCERHLQGRLVSAAVAVACLAACAAMAAPNPPIPAALDLLQLPAPATAHGERKLLLDVTRAGARLVAVGEFGLILWSDDEGHRWHQATVPTSAMLTCVTFVDASHGWAAGHDGVILASVDGGTTWTRQFDGRQANAQMLEAARVQVRAANGGKGADETSQRRRDQAQDRLDDAQAAIDAGPSRPLLGLHFTDTAHGYAVGAFGQLFQTADGGAHWAYIGDRLPGGEGLHLNAISQSAPGTLYIAAEAGTVFRSTDAGRSWTRSSVDYTGHLFGVLPLAAPTVLAYGFGGHVFRSVDGGSSWRKVDSRTSKAVVQGGELVDGCILLVAQDGQMMLSRDGGQRFDALPVRPQLTKTSGFALANAGHGVIAVGLGGVAAVDLAVVGGATP